MSWKTVKNCNNKIVSPRNPATFNTQTKDEFLEIWKLQLEFYHFPTVAFATG